MTQSHYTSFFQVFPGLQWELTDGGLVYHRPNELEWPDLALSAAPFSLSLFRKQKKNSQKVCIVNCKLRQCRYTTLNFLPWHVAPLLAAYYLNRISQRFLTPTSPSTWKKEAETYQLTNQCYNLPNFKTDWFTDRQVFLTWFGPRAVTGDHKSK